MRFQCKNCGWCCKTFGTYHFLPVFEWEKDILEEEAEKIGVHLEFCKIPGDLVLDKKTGKAICCQFGIKNEPCPFLSNNNTCTIYEKRPLICREYPLTHSPLIKESVLRNNELGHCENNDVVLWRNERFGAVEGGPKVDAKRSELIKLYSEIFGRDMIVDATKNATINEMYAKMLLDLSSDGYIKLRKISNFDYYMHDPIPILNFVSYIGAASDDFVNEFQREILHSGRTEKLVDGEIFKLK